jgi:hypothetical protein
MAKELLAPNGKPSNLTPEQYKLVRTPAFKKWFGDWEKDPANSSKVVDENGEPMVVYHTTSKDFYVFSKKKSKEGFFFAPNKSRLSVYGKSKIDSYFLNIVNPSYEMFKSDLKYLIPKGYDGIMDYGHAKHLGNKNLYEIIAFEPNQIKLSDGTNTTFDLGNDDIRFDDGGMIEDFINRGIVELKFYETTPEHAREYGLISKKPIYLQTLFVSEKSRLNGVGKQVLEYLENYAKNNGNDLIFGHINNKAQFTKDKRETFFSDVDMIRYWLHDNGYAINNDNNDFHKLIRPNEKNRFAKGGATEIGTPDYLRMFLGK